MKRYLNMKTCYGVETVDELSRSDFETNKAFKAELIRLCGEYIDSGMSVYVSQRCDKTWNK